VGIFLPRPLVAKAYQTPSTSMSAGSGKLSVITASETDRFSMAADKPEGASESRLARRRDLESISELRNSSVSASSDALYTFVHAHSHF